LVKKYPRVKVKIKEIVVAGMNTIIQVVFQHKTAV